MPEADSEDAPYHAHIYYAPEERAAAAALQERLRAVAPDDPLSALRFVGELRDGKLGPHPISQFEIHFEKRLLPLVEDELARTGLRILFHPLTLDDLADHTTLARWIGEPLELDPTPFDPPGANQGIARFGKTDFKRAAAARGAAGSRMLAIMPSTAVVKARPTRMVSVSTPKLPELVVAGSISFPKKLP